MTNTEIEVRADGPGCWVVLKNGAVLGYLSRSRIPDLDCMMHRATTVKGWTKRFPSFTAALDALLGIDHA